jgi:hypothetical protein
MYLSNVLYHQPMSIEITLEECFRVLHKKEYFYKKSTSMHIFPFNIGFAVKIKNHFSFLTPWFLWCWMHARSSNPTQARCTRYSIKWSRLTVTCGMSVVFWESPVSSTNKTEQHLIFPCIRRNTRNWNRKIVWRSVLGGYGV